MPYDKAEVNFQSGPKTDPDANENGDGQGKGPVPFGGSNSRHWIVLIRCEDVLDRILLKQLERGAHCQTRIGIGVTCAYKLLSYRSDSRVRGDCDRRPVPVCED